MTRKKMRVVKHHYEGHKHTHGEAHPKAMLSDHEIELMRQLHEEYPVGHPKHLGYRRLAKVFDVAKTTVRHICNYEARNAKGK